MKQCKGCLERKPLDDFHNNRSKPDGKEPQCKACRSAYWKSRYDRKYAPIVRDGDGRECRRCNVYKTWDEFSNDSYCRVCASAIGRHHALLKKGLTVDAYIAMERTQDFKCAICGDPEPLKQRLSVDHDHSCCPGAESCGKCVRGLLCFRCNSMLGMARDSADILRLGADYLERY